MRLRRMLLGALLALAALLASAQETDDAILAVHVVQRGENLFRIALQYDMFAEQVAQANGMQLTDSLQPGKRLIIPLYMAGTPTPEPVIALVDPLAPTALPTLPPTFGAPHNFSREGAMPDSYIHTVSAGETLFLIGLQYNQTVDTLVRANNLTNPDALSIGQRLVVPGIYLPALTSPLPPLVQAFTLDPLVFKEGQTNRIELRTQSAAEVTGEFLGQELRTISREGGARHNILVGLPMFTETNVYPLTLQVTAAGATYTISASVQVISGGYLRQSLRIDDSELLAREVEAAEIALLSAAATWFAPERAWGDSLSLPAADNMNAFFGTLRSYNGSPFDRYHSGVDFAGATGASAMSAAAGKVVMVERLQIRGNTVLIDHGWGIYTVYAHLNEALTQAGAQVAAGEIIGTIGNTGRSTGPHLHWEVWVNGVNVDPLQWVNERFP